MQTQCPNCKTLYKTAQENEGKQARCKSCGKGFQLIPLANPGIIKPDDNKVSGLYPNPDKSLRKNTRVVSVINYKGGVAKTTTTIALAEKFSEAYHKKVLVIDLDPQISATIMLLGIARWKRLNAKNLTLAGLFNYMCFSNTESFDLNSAIQKNVSNVAGASSVDLLPSSIGLFDIQNRIAPFQVDLLEKGVKNIIDNYDIILIDCPPNLGLVTLNGLFISDCYLAPTIPEPMSTYGISEIKKQISKFAKETKAKISMLGVVCTKYQANSRIHNDEINELKADATLPIVYNSVIRQSSAIAKAGENNNTRMTYLQKYGHNGYNELAAEIAEDLRW